MPLLPEGDKTCGGTTVAPDAVVTAASCLYNEKKRSGPTLTKFMLYMETSPYQGCKLGLMYLITPVPLPRYILF